MAFGGCGGRFVILRRTSEILATPAGRGRPKSVRCSSHVKLAEIAHRMTYVLQLSPILVERRGQRGGTISGGQQQMAD